MSHEFLQFKFIELIMNQKYRIRSTNIRKTETILSSRPSCSTFQLVPSQIYLSFEANKGQPTLPKKNLSCNSIFGRLINLDAD